MRPAAHPLKRARSDLDARPPGHKPGSCAEAINLTKGALFFSGKASKTGASGKIVAGTGAYAGALGTLVATSRSATKTLIVIRLRRK